MNRTGGLRRPMWIDYDRLRQAEPGSVAELGCRCEALPATGHRCEWWVVSGIEWYRTIETMTITIYQSLTITSV